MIQCRLRELMALKGRLERRRITYDHILAGTGISKNTLSRLANNLPLGVSISVIDRLCAYFPCQPGDLLVYVPDEEAPSRGGNRRAVDRPTGVLRRRAPPS